MAAGLPQVDAGDMRGVDQRVAALQVLVAHPVFHLLAHDAALGMPEDQPRPGQFLDGEQVELLAQHAMVALLGFLDLVQVLVQVLPGEERGAVDALQLRVVLVAQPVRAGDVEQLERLDAPGGRDVRPAAEVGELAGLVDGDLLVGRGELLDEVALHEVAFRLEALQALLAREKFARVGQVLLHQLLHLLLDGLQVLGGEGLLAIEVVEESALGCRAVAELGLGKELQHRSRHQVRRGVAIDFQRFGIAVGQDAQFGILLQRTGEVDQLGVVLRRLGRGGGSFGGRLVAVATASVMRQRLDLGGQCGVSQTRADALGDIECGGTTRHVFDAAVGQFHMNVFSHDVKPIAAFQAADYQELEFIGGQKQRAIPAAGPFWRAVGWLPGCSLAAGAHFQHQRADQSDCAETESHRDGHVFVGVGHIDLATPNDAINDGPNDTQKQSEPHAAGSEQQCRKQHPHRRGEEDGELAALLGGRAMAMMAYDF